VRFEDPVKEAAAGPREVERRMVLRVPVESMIDIILFIYLIKKETTTCSSVVSFGKIMRGCEEEGAGLLPKILRWHVSDAKGF